MSPFVFSCILVAFTSLGLGFFVFIRSSDKKLGTIWLLFSTSVAGYGIGNVWLDSTQTQEMTRWALSADYGFGIVWIAPFFYHFVCTFLDMKRARSISIHYLVGFVFVLIVSTPLFFKRVDWMFDSLYFGISGKCYPWFLLWWMGLVTYSHYLMVRSYRSVSTTKRNQIKYFFLATAIGFTGGSLCFLPNFEIHLYPWGNFAVVLYPVIMSFAILKHHLLDIHVFIRKTLVYSLVSTTVAAIYAGLVTLLAFLVGAHNQMSVVFSSPIDVAQKSFGYGCLATAILSVGLGTFVFAKGWKKPVNRLWFLLSLSVSFWSFGLGMMVYSLSFGEAEFWQTWFLYSGAIMIPVLFLHFVTCLLDVHQKGLLICSYVISVVFEAINCIHRFAAVIPRAPFNFYTFPLPPYKFYVIFYFTVALYANALLFQYMQCSTGLRNQQIKYVLLGSLVGFCGGPMTFFMVFDIPIFPYGVYAVPLYIVIVSYAIFKHQLMDIRVVIRKTLLYSLVSAVLAAVYVATITLLARVLGEQYGSVSAVTSALAAIFITLLFNPVRLRFQRFVDRHFFREALDQELLREATSGFVHEIKRPLANISLPAELSLMDLEDLKNKRRPLKDVLPKLEQRLQYILHQTMDAGNKIEAIREFSNSNGKPLEELDLAGIIRNSVSIEGSLLRRYQVKLMVNIDDDLPRINAHAKQLEIVFANLIKNAAEALNKADSSVKRIIEVRAYKEDGKVTISVKDTGPGIKRENLPHLFEPYFTTKGANGMGMGLYLCRQIIQVHGGTIRASNEPSGGAVFQIILPYEGQGSRE